MNGTDENRLDDEIMAQAAKLATSVRPQRDLWPAVEQAINAPAVRGRSSWNAGWAQAAAVVLLVAGSSLLTYLITSDGEDPTVPSIAESPVLVFEPVSGSFGSQYNLGPDFTDARRDLVDRLENELSRMSPEAREAVLTNLQTIRKAIDDINQALAREPDNVLLQELLINTYRDELTLMRQVDGISAAAMQRNDI